MTMSEASRPHEPGGPTPPGRPRALRAAVVTGLVVAGLVVSGALLVPRGLLDEPAPLVVARAAGLAAEPAPVEPRWVARAEPTPPRDGVPPAQRPNVVLITADDMAATDLRWMPRTRRLLGGAGVRLTSFLSNHPICCPARAEILTGQYAHNNGVHDNDGRYGGHQALLRPHDTLGAWLRDAGYRTAFVGKYLNGWELAPGRQIGWTVFNPLLRDVYRYVGFTLFNDGSPRTYPRGYSTDVIGRYARTTIRRFSRDDVPFFLWVAPVAPHNRMSPAGWRPPGVAPRHRDLFASVEPPSLDNPSFNEVDVSDKPLWVTRERLLPPDRARTDHRARVRSLAALDEQVARIVASLEEAGELDDTVVAFTSDNGYLLGEHRMHGKNLPYEESLKVPFLARGPGLPDGEVRGAQYGLVDLAPTILDLADARSQDRVLDGRSMLGTLRRGGGGYPTYLIQASTRNVPWWWRGVRSSRFTYVRYTSGFQELYDRARDPAQLVNVAADPSYAAVVARLSARLDQLADCSGRTCW
ncbi:sulfatase [Nocardioides sp. HDW12B]|uniref:sulfatase family protein n=1 Tax=Nocardioides sp. HDW12B TaxID=2714939 RepID=UPI00140BAEC7|nr:sulfatase [Nocardioides sp. HDW12B]QIK65889.1 sulfatase [Nocardioides sp. HDW12B]